MNGHPRRSFRHAQPLAYLGVSRAPAFPGQQAPGFSEEILFAVRLALPLEGIHRLLQDGKRPLPQEFLFGRLVVGWFDAVPFLGFLLVERNESELSPAFLPMGAAPFSRQEVVQRGQKKSPELALVAVSQPQMMFADELGEKLLGQVLGVIRPVPLPAHIYVD